MTAPTPVETVLVTGGAGRLGRAVVEVLKGICDVKVMDSTPQASPGQLLGDIAVLADCEHAMQGVDAVVHLAAVPLYNGDDVGIWNVNATGTFNVFEAARRGGVRRVVFASSICAQGFINSTRPIPISYLPVDEAHPGRPDDMYGLSKLVGEQLGYAYAQRSGIQVTCLRFGTVIFQDDPEATERWRGRFRDHAAMRPFLWNYVDSRDAASAIELALTSKDRERYRVFNIGAAETSSDLDSRELVDLYFAGRETPHLRGHLLESSRAPFFDISHARAQLGYEPHFSIHQRI